MIDCHTHSNYSHDGTESVDKMANKALDMGLEFLAITDHNDKDYLGITNYDIPQLDIENYYKEITEIKKLFKGKLDIGLGLECGYSKTADKIYQRELKKYDFDVIINSVHTVLGDDCYYPMFFENKDKDLAYSAYLETVRQSLNAQFQFDVVGHIGYVTRNAPYEDKKLNYFEYSERIDDILKTIIEKNKCLEINTRANPYLPNMEILKRYKKLGGELITFGSDAHSSERIAENYDIVSEAVRSIGFKYFTIYKNHTPKMIKIEK